MLLLTRRKRMPERKRVTLWFSEGEMRDIDAAAARAGVETGAACRLAVIRAIHGVCRDASEGRVRLRARSAPAPVLGRTHVEPPAIAPAAPPHAVEPALLVPEPGAAYDTLERMMSRAEIARRPR
jgi:hypothetical protein